MIKKLLYMQFPHSPDGSDVPDFSMVYSNEPIEPVQYSQLEITASKNLGDPKNTLDDAEVVELGCLELIVERGLKVFWEIGEALKQIRDKRLYRQEHGTFEDYCLCRWEMSRRSAYQLIEAATVYENVRHGAQILPANERQIRPLVALTPDKQQEAWAKAVSTAPNGRVTSTHVAQIAKEYQQKASSSRSQNKNISKRPRNHITDKLTNGKTTPNQAETDLRSCWNCHHCSREFLHEPYSFYCYQLGKLNLMEKDSNERGAKCEFWVHRQATPDQIRGTPGRTETFTLTLQLPTYLQPLIQDAARGEGLVLVDWVTKVVEAALLASTH